MGKKKSTFKNIMVTLGCTVFAGVYALGGGYAAYKLLGGTGNTQPAWLDRVEIHVDEQNASGGVTEASNNNPFDFGKVPQKPRFEEKEEETETTDETETESEAERARQIPLSRHRQTLKRRARQKLMQKMKQILT